MNIVIATGNQDKYREILKILPDNKNYSYKWLGDYPEIGEIEESGSTLNENALIKAVTVARRINLITVADDTGLFVDALDGRPGVYSARYAGSNATYEDNVAKLLEELTDIPAEKRSAEFRCVTCIAIPGKNNIFNEGIVKGRITIERRGENGFGYDPVFEVEDTGKTFAQMAEEKKNSISHRYRSFKKVAEFLLSRGVAQFG